MEPLQFSNLVNIYGQFMLFKIAKYVKIVVLLTPSYRGGGGGVEYAPLLFFLHHPKTAEGIKLKLSDFKDTLVRHILQVKPVR